MLKKRKKYFVFFISFVLFFFSLNHVSANLVCGFLNSDGLVSYQGFNVEVYYKEKPFEKNRCLVNSEGKYCCDLQRFSTPFSPNKDVVTEVFDEDTGLFAKKQEIKTTTQGFSLFPNLTLEEAIKIRNLTNLIVNSTTFNFFVETAEGFENVSIFLNGNKEFFCENCSSANLTFNLTKGKNIIQIVAGNERKMTKNFSVYSLDFFMISNEVRCTSCKRNRVKSNETFELITRINSSHVVEGRIDQYTPSDFVILTEIPFEKFSEDYNKISFYINSSFSNFSYTLKAPLLRSTKIFEIKNTFLDFENSFYLRVTKFFLPIATGKVVLDKKKESTNEKFFKFNKGFPVVFKEGDFKIVIFLKREGLFKISSSERSEGKDIKIINFFSNIPKKEIESIVLYSNYTVGEVFLIKNKEERKLEYINLTNGVFLDDLDFSLKIKKQQPKKNER